MNQQTMKICDILSEIWLLHIIRCRSPLFLPEHLGYVVGEHRVEVFEGLPPLQGVLLVPSEGGVGALRIPVATRQIQHINLRTTSDTLHIGQEQAWIKQLDFNPLKAPRTHVGWARTTTRAMAYTRIKFIKLSTMKEGHTDGS